MEEMIDFSPPGYGASAASTIGPNPMAVVTAKTGAPLDPGQILARKGQKGIWEDTLAEGRHFLNPVFYEHDIVPAVVIGPGEVGINQVSLPGRTGGKVVTKARQLGQSQALSELQANVLERQEAKRADYYSQRKAVAEIAKKTAAVSDGKVRELGQAQAEALEKVAGEGTLWTDLEKTGFAELGGAQQLKRKQ